MKRFYADVTTAPADGGHAILLDGRSVKTPKRAALIAPTPMLANAIAAEWEAQAETLDPRTMPLTGIANAAIDQVLANPAPFAAIVAVYGETELLCYRADSPAELVARQAATWDPLLGWARERYDIGFTLVTGIMHQPQPAETVARLAQAVSALDPFRLAALQPIVTIGGSLVVALALLEDHIDPVEAFDTTHLDELWQVEQWGEDVLAAQARDARRHDFAAAARFLTLL
ncbi:ATP12 family chaperone protein [Sphingomonas montanisoli]|uniref:ATPase n=1 Tax=Sphingomonas montanisoli TaxID=2606412 RepID=A0A5D9C3R5_9SPHN|nr:ATP12 family protein [Sphingomonas montanisoli]TZG26319.1 ATPase [Sphingomonas montanisoli]